MPDLLADSYKKIEERKRRKNNKKTLHREEFSDFPKKIFEFSFLS